MQITFAENGKEAVEKFSAGKFDLVLMDLQMPIMGGLAAMRAIRAWEKERGRTPTPMLAVSANATDEHVLEAKEAGADDHVAKPIVRETLFEAIARVCTSRGGCRNVTRRWRFRPRRVRYRGLTFFAWMRPRAT